MQLKKKKSSGDADASGPGATLRESLIQIFTTVQDSCEEEANLNRHSKDAEEEVFLISI